MRAVVLAAILIVATLATPVDIKKPSILGGALCIPCEDLIRNGENNEIGDFDTWFEKETNKVCGGLGILKGECKAYFKSKENEFNHFIKTKADPAASCKEIDFC
ncbi:unnamed protein product [Auanema sp. JU1783]|nr:unnamed protein product [Auanema sp. JU1783]